MERFILRQCHLMIIVCLILYFQGIAASHAGQIDNNDAIAIVDGKTHWLSEPFTSSFNETKTNIVRRKRQVNNGCTSQQLNKYRSADGRCNNLANPSAGSAATVYQRIAPASYDDGKSAIRRSVTGRKLPSGRLISTSVFTNKLKKQAKETIMVMAFGQFFEHDLTHIVPIVMQNGSNIRCCSGPLFGALIQPTPHTECLPIAIARNDILYNPQRQSGALNDCMNFVRSQFRTLNNGVREAINVHTHWMDMSNVYGNSQRLADHLRNSSSRQGLMKTSIGHPNGSVRGRQFMPQTCCIGTTCCAGTNCACFLSGDDRVNQNPPLRTLHTIWLREHNRVAQQLVRLIPNRTDEFYFQEARRIVIAEYQHITFTEFLPVFLGAERAARIMNKKIHNQDADPAVFTEWATAAFRVGHSMINTLMGVYERNGELSNQTYIVGDQINSFFGPQFLRNRIVSDRTYMDNLIRGLLLNHNDQADNDFPAFITGQLFKSPPGPGDRLGFDLTAINIQRGRDHGLPPYAHFWAESQSELLGRRVQLKDFKSLSSTTPKKIIASLQSVYDSVEDIDLFVGGVTEKPLPGSLVGPTFTYIIAQQFENIKLSDPFFYDLLNARGTFTKDQLAEIKNASLSRIICDNSDGTISKIQSIAFKIPTATGVNRLVACDSLPSINFRKYTESLTVGK